MAFSRRSRLLRKGPIEPDLDFSGAVCWHFVSKHRVDDGAQGSPGPTHGRHRLVNRKSKTEIIMDTVVVDGHGLTLRDVMAVASRQATVALTDDAEQAQRIRASCEFKNRLVSSGVPVYGVTTGPGNAVNTQIGADRASRLQANIVRALGCGLGDYLPVEECRASVVARVNCLARGYSGVRLELIDRLVDLLNRDIVPCIREIGSVGASGDLIPSSYIAAVLLGQREVYYRGEIRSTADVYRELGLDPLTLESKEALALVNGTTVMTGVAILAVEAAQGIGILADACTAMTAEVLMSLSGPFDPFLHDVAKPHPGQISSATRIRRLLEGGSLIQSYQEVVRGLGTLEEGRRTLPRRIQDNYSIRCAPQCVGSLYDAIEWVRQMLEAELNSSNDNPLFDEKTGSVHSGGNFSGFHVGLAMDTLKIAVASVADLVDRQFQLVVDEKYNAGLGVCCRNPLPDDHPEAGTHLGFQAMQLAMSAVAAEALNAAAPMTIFSRSTACHNQDKVSMATTAARQAREVVGLTQQALAIHLLILAQAADLRGADRLGKGTQAVYEAIRNVSPFVEADRELEGDIREVLELVRSGLLSEVVEGATPTR